LKTGIFFYKFWISFQEQDISDSKYFPACSDVLQTRNFDLA